MNFNYLDYESDLFETAVQEESALYVCAHTGDLREANKVYRKYNREPLVQQSKFLLWPQLKELVFPVAELTLKEEKLSLIIYQLLTKSEKETLNINDYNDVLEFSARFNNFYLEMSEYLVRDLPELEGWQQERLNVFKSLRERYVEWLQAHQYTDRSLVYQLKNFNPAALSDLAKIVLINPIAVSPLEKEVIRRLDENFNITAYLQLSAEDYREEDLCLKQLTLPEELPTELELYTAGDDLLQLASALKIGEERQADFISPNLSRKNYAGYLSEREIYIQTSLQFSGSAPAKFLECLHRLLVPFTRQKVGLLPASDLLEILNYPVFKRYFALDESVKRQLTALISAGYFYLDQEGIKKEIPALMPVYETLQSLAGFKDLTSLLHYIDGLDIASLEDPRFQNEIDQIFDGILELATIAELDLIKDWKNLYTQPAAGLLKLVLNYLGYKKLKSSLDSPADRLKMLDLELAPAVKRQELIIINASQGEFAAGGGQTFILNGEQRKALGLPTAKDYQKRQRYNFFRHIFTAEKAAVFALDNQDENISPGSMLEEIQYNYQLKYNTAPVTNKDYDSLLVNTFGSGQNFSFGPYHRKEFTEDLFQNVAEETGGKTSLTYYKYRTLKDCYHRYYLEHILGFEPALELPAKAMNPKLFGIMVHELMENVLDQLNWQWLLGEREINIDESFISEQVEALIYRYRLFYDQRFSGYYHQLVQPRLVEAVENFLGGLLQRLPLVEAEGKGREWQYYLEYSPDLKEDYFYENGDIQVYLNGRIDLLLKREDKAYIIDFKSGSGSAEQLDFYSLLLNKREGEDNFHPLSPDKYIYNIISQQFEQGNQGKEDKMAAKITEQLEDIFNSDYYTRIYKSRCQRCPYLAVCRVVEV
ncbi:MAG: RecB family exonuclease [Bacillota bacterium]